MAIEPISLSEQLAWAARTLQAVEQGRSLTESLAKPPARLRPGVQALAFHALRHWGQASVLITLLAERPPEGAARSLLALALTLLLPDAAHSNVQYAAHTVVDQAVAALTALRLPRGMTGFLNACLRRYLREQDELLAEAETDWEARWNHPFWWIQRVRRDHPQHWQAILAANNQAAPMVLRVNRRRTERDVYLARLHVAGWAAHAVGDDGIVLQQAAAVESLPGWHSGDCSVQDSAAQLAVPLLLAGADLAPGARVLDACAAPGGKTAHLLESADLSVLALDVDAQRCQRIRDNLQRLQLSATVCTADAAQPEHWWDGQAFDAILLDAPCTASGIVRRHPDVRWLRRVTDIAQLAEQQRRLLEALWPTLKVGGRLLYCTCSVFKAEGEQQMQQFLQRHPEAQWLPSPGHLLPGQSSAAVAGGVGDGMDGFFMPCCSSAHPSKTLRSTPLSRRVVCWWLLGGSWALMEPGMAAEAADSNNVQMAVVRRSDGLFLSARLPLELSPAIEDVLQKGVPLHFLWQAQVIQSRWYWLDKTVSSVARTVRLAYQPLTRRWRLSYATGAPTVTGLQYAVHQNFDSLTDALVSAGQVSNWKLAAASAFKNDVPQRVEFSFALDLTQLPRPFQLGLLNQTGWNITYQKILPVPEHLTPDAEGNSPDSKTEVDA